MFPILVVLCIALASSQVDAYTLQQRQQGDLFALECLTETGVNPASIALLKIGDFTANEKRAKCFVRCFFQKEGFMNADGELLPESIVEALSNDFEREKLEKVVSSCQVKSEDACDSAFLMYECLYKNRENL
ncbi:general odorant-binding protein 56d-like [Malaya genurostris]|uniref:general odorant-binding protein 56d-like n=1 Tax=Malaya genurostris TaxID=325434 RepID=UPI0026F4058F|nr:general odorant-binding protein 56d-like [Malaya genurostris]